jgi:hypothetical protein
MDYIELSFLERRIILNYLKIFDQINLQKFGSKIFADFSVLNTTIKKPDLIQCLISSLPDYKNIQVESENTLYEQYTTLTMNLSKLRSKKKAYISKSRARKKRR